MIAKIRNHITAFGDKFIVAEFGLAALVAGGVALAFLVTARYGLAFIAAGIALNCVPMVAYGLRAWAHPEASRGPRPDDRQTLTDTLVLSAVFILPYVLLAATTYEQWRAGQTHQR